MACRAGLFMPRAMRRSSAMRRRGFLGSGPTQDVGQGFAGHGGRVGLAGWSLLLQRTALGVGAIHGQRTALGVGAIHGQRAAALDARKDVLGGFVGAAGTVHVRLFVIHDSELRSRSKSSFRLRRSSAST